MLSKYNTIRNTMMMMVLVLSGAAAQAQTATGVINGTLNHKDGIALIFDTDPGGVVLGSSGTSAVSLDFGAISAFGPLAAGVSRPSVGVANYTVRTVFDVNVIQGGLSSTTYTLSAQLAAVAPTGFTYSVDAVTLTTVSQTIQVNAAYSTDIPHNLNLTVLTAAPGAGGPAVGTPLTATINFTATAN